MNPMLTEEILAVKPYSIFEFQSRWYEMHHLLFGQGTSSVKDK